ncbi:MAG: undecaprenyl/decaprenyl-phosphate alpha-N-acetylglucosaminyl 1-phosphate transferase [Phycisphaerales bacterium]|nr:MAG: undecaprenyl/decaprenyl-phosphate alpha-N-acetylglucosaminyl 1-phosphate transferase [Phycisphaerales bacterium]
MLWPALGLILVGFAIAAPLTALLVRMGHRLAALDTGGAAGHRKELRPVPNIGGIAIFWAVAFPFAVGLGGFWLLSDERIVQLLPALEPHLDRVRETTPTALALLIGMAVLHITGLVDDRRPLGAWSKLGVQLAIALVMVAWFDIRLLTVLDHWLGIGPLPSVVVSVLWIIVITNAINFLDNMDGLAAGVCAIAAALFMTATLINAQWFIAGTLALLIGALIGFLIFNFPPAKIFMGDGGSLVIGFLLAILTARTTYFNPDDPAFALGGGWYGVFMPLIVLAIPIYDFLSVTLIRLSKGQSPFVGDQQHVSHRLVRRGLSRRGAVLVLWAATAVTGLGGIVLGSLEPWQAQLVGVQTMLVLLMFALLEHATARRDASEDAGT